jgi:uncharacterized membrane protein YgcG
MLKDLQTEFGLRVYVEKEMHGTNTGMRTVVLASQSPSGVYLLCFVCYSVQLFTFMLAFGELPPLYPVVCCCGRVLLCGVHMMVAVLPLIKLFHVYSVRITDGGPSPAERQAMVQCQERITAMIAANAHASQHQFGGHGGHGGHYSNGTSSAAGGLSHSHSSSPSDLAPASA